MHLPSPASLLAAGALLACASLAQAQYMWINEKGVKEFSDRAPPPSIPLSHILKAPNGQPHAQAQESRPAAPTLAERNADYDKRTKAQAERDKKIRADDEAKAALTANCALSKEAKRTLDSGVRIAQRDKNGERSYMDDEQRAVETKKAEKVLAACK